MAGFGIGPSSGMGGSLGSFGQGLKPNNGIRFGPGQGGSLNTGGMQPSMQGTGSMDAGPMQQQRTPASPGSIYKGPQMQQNPGSLFGNGLGAPENVPPGIGTPQSGWGENAYPSGSYTPDKGPGLWGAGIGPSNNFQTPPMQQQPQMLYPNNGLANSGMIGQGNIGGGLTPGDQSQGLTGGNPAFQNSPWNSSAPYFGGGFNPFGNMQNGIRNGPGQTPQY